MLSVYYLILFLILLIVIVCLNLVKLGIDFSLKALYDSTWVITFGRVFIIIIYLLLNVFFLSLVRIFKTQIYFDLKNITFITNLIDDALLFVVKFIYLHLYLYSSLNININVNVSVSLNLDNTLIRFLLILFLLLILWLITLLLFNFFLILRCYSTYISISFTSLYIWLLQFFIIRRLSIICLLNYDIFCNNILKFILLIENNFLTPLKGGVLYSILYPALFPIYNTFKYKSAFSNVSQFFKLLPLFFSISLFIYDLTFNNFVISHLFIVLPLFPVYYLLISALSRFSNLLYFCFNVHLALYFYKSEDHFGNKTKYLLIKEGLMYLTAPYDLINLNNLRKI